MNVSQATEENWKRLSSVIDGKLERGANKSLSKRMIVPREYICTAGGAEKIRNITDLCRRHGISRCDVLYTAACIMLEKSGALSNAGARSFLQKSGYSYFPHLSESVISENERDFLGALYQSLLTEGEKSVAGSYYTPGGTAEALLKDICYDGKKTFFDPCCGSGSLFLELTADDPEQIYGCDNDPLAVFISGVNLLLKYPQYDFVPQVRCCNYLESGPTGKKFDCIATNPPWGAASGRGETFSRFFMRALDDLKDDGFITFLLPESFLTVKHHRDFRRNLLTGTRIRSVAYHDVQFSGVMSKAVILSAWKSVPAANFIFERGSEKCEQSVSEILSERNAPIYFINSEDREIIDHINKSKKYDLSRSVFALGIVTGNNKSKIKQKYFPGSEAIFSGRDIEPYRIAEKSSGYLRYDKSELQQTAPEEIYRAKEKLIYKFISQDLVFAFDDRQRLFLNSANTVIPNIPDMSIKTVLAFLNSRVMRYYYRIKFPGMKVLKSHLCELPFPEITADMNEKISVMASRLLQGESALADSMEELISDCYFLTAEQREHINDLFPKAQLS